MKILICLISFIIFFSENSFSQKAAWDSTYRPGTFETRVQQYKQFKNHKKDIIFLGNSITDYTEWNELLSTKHARNRGISGDITFGVLERIDEVSEGQPAKVFILIGINDIARNIPDSVIKENYLRMIAAIRSASPGTHIYFQTLLPVNGDFPSRSHFKKDEHILAINQFIRNLPADKKLTIIDLYPLFLDSQGKLDKKYTYDGLHLNGEGYRHWASVLSAYIK